MAVSFIVYTYIYGETWFLVSFYYLKQHKTEGLRLCYFMSFHDLNNYHHHVFMGLFDKHKQVPYELILLIALAWYICRYNKNKSIDMHVSLTLL